MSGLVPTGIREGWLVISGRRAIGPTRTAKRSETGSRFHVRSAAPAKPRRRSIRPSALATHSSTPTRGRSRASGGLGRFGSAGSLISYLLDRAGAEQTRRPQEHECDQHPEDDRVLELRRPVPLGERFGDPDEEAAEHRAWNVSDSADNCRSEGLQARLEAHEV